MFQNIKVLSKSNTKCLREFVFSFTILPLGLCLSLFTFVFAILSEGLILYIYFIFLFNKYLDIKINT